MAGLWVWPPLIIHRQATVVNKQVESMKSNRLDFKLRLQGHWLTQILHASSTEPGLSTRTLLPSITQSHWASVGPPHAVLTQSLPPSLSPSNNTAGRGGNTRIYSIQCNKVLHNKNAAWKSFCIILLLEWLFLRSIINRTVFFRVNSFSGHYCKSWCDSFLFFLFYPQWILNFDIQFKIYSIFTFTMTLGLNGLLA